jgi:TonB family protein
MENTAPSVGFDTLPYRRLAAALGVSAGIHLLIVLTVVPVSPMGGAVPRIDVLTVSLVADRGDETGGRANDAVSATSTSTRQTRDASARSTSPEPAATPRPQLTLAATATRYYPTSEVDVPAQVLNDALLRYPPDAYEQGIEGKVVLRIYIGADGAIDEIKLKDAVPSGVFENAALEAAWQLRYSPALKDGRPVPNVRTVAIVFDPSDAPL